MAPKKLEGVPRRANGTIKRKYPYRRSPWRILSKGVKIHGRQPKWTEEELDKMADKMYDWVMKHPEVLFVRPFFTSETIRISTVYDILHVSKKFEETYRFCQQVCADRLHDAILKNKVNAGYATRFMHFFDRELNKKDQENEQQKLSQTLEVTKKAEHHGDGIKVVLEVRKEK